MHIKRRTSYRIPRELGQDQLKVDAVKDNDVQLSKRFLSSKTEIECYNFTGRVIRTYDHMGVCCIHKPLTTTPDTPEFIGCFVMKKRYEIHDDTQVVHNVSERHLTLSEEAERYAEDVVRDINRSRGFSRRSIGHYFKIKYADMTRNGGSIYVKATDLVIVDETYQDVVVHPNSKAYLDMCIEQLYDSAHTYSIEINDPQGTGDPYYVNLNSQVFEIKPTRDVNIGDGVKIVFKEPNSPARTVHTSNLEEDNLKAIGIFKNYRDADQYGKRFDLQLAEIEKETQLTKAQVDNQSTKNKLVLDEQSTENKLLEILSKMQLLDKQTSTDDVKWEAERMKHEREMEKMQNELKLQRENHQRDIENMRMKDYFDTRSHYRKDSSEALKFLPVLVGGVLAAFALLK